MSTEPTPAVAGFAPRAAGGDGIRRVGLAAAVAALVIVMLLPRAPDLPPAGQGMLAILAFAVIVWMTEALAYDVSAVVIAALMTFLLAFTPDVGAPGRMAMGSAAALNLTLTGFSTSAVALMAAACFIAAAMRATDLDRRIALTVLAKADAKAHHIVIGAMVAGVLLAFLVPSATARTACLLPILLGFVYAFGEERRSRFAALLVITAAHTASIWAIGIKTAAQQNLVAMGFIESQLGTTISWTQWFVVAAPFSALLTVALYFIMTRLIKPELTDLPGGLAAVSDQLASLGPVTAREWRLLALVLGLLAIWSTENLLHRLDTTTTALAAVALMMAPRIGVMSWKESQRGFPWGMVALFAIGISVGAALLKTHAAGWLGQMVVQHLGLAQASAFEILMRLSLFLIVIHLGFASATALATAMIPIIISVLSAVQTPGLNVVGMTLLLQLVVSFGFILPVNTPQNMIAFSTGTFAARDFVRTGLVLTLAAVALLALFALSYWPWLGMMTTTAG